MSERDSRGWALEPFGAGATRLTRGQEVNVSIDDNGDIDIRIDEGSGWLSQSCSTWIPRDILVRMLEQAGATITWELPKETLPSDYEPCGDCGYDHGYEQNEAVKAHSRT